MTPTINARDMRAELLRRFSWLDTCEDVSGADVIDSLSDWYDELKQQEKRAASIPPGGLTGAAQVRPSKHPTRLQVERRLYIALDVHNNPRLAAADICGWVGRFYEAQNEPGWDWRFRGRKLLGRIQQYLTENSHR